MRKIFYGATLLFFISLSVVYADSFRVRKVVTAGISITERSKKVQMGYNDALAIQLPKDLLFFEGLEIEVKIPRELLEYRGSVAYSLYENVSPPPSDKKIDYDGKAIVMDVFQTRLSMILQIPIREKHSVKSSPYATLLPVYNVSNSSQVFLRFHPIMKGLPSFIDDIIFDVTVKPLLKNEGLLDLQINYPADSENTDFFLFIDEEEVDFTGEPLIIEDGMHHLSIVSDYFRNEAMTFSINQAEKTVVTIDLKDIAPTLFVVAPEKAQVYVNDVVFEANKTQTIAPGDYLVKIIVDDYEIAKTIAISLGKSYEVKFVVDMLVTEEQ